MATTNFPNGISSEGQRHKAGTLTGGTAVLTGGTFATGLDTVTHIVASVATGGTGFAYCAARPATGGSAIVTCHAASGSAATTAGTVMWFAAGT